MKHFYHILQGKKLLRDTFRILEIPNVHYALFLYVNDIYFCIRISDTNKNKIKTFSVRYVSSLTISFIFPLYIGKFC